MPNIGRNASAKSEAELKRKEPRHSVMNRHVNRITEGIEIIIVVVWKNVATLLLMPVRYIW